MTSYQEDKFTMYKVVQEFVNKFGTVWAGLAAFVTAFGDFEAVIAAVENAREKQETRSEGRTQDKQSLREEVADDGHAVASIVQAYAEDNNDNTLFESVNFSESELGSAADTILRDKAQVIHDQANGVIGSLAPYGLVPAELADFQTLINDFNTAIPQPRNAIITRKTGTGEIKTLLRQGDRLLRRRLDKLMENFRETNPDFYDGYFSARIIIEQGTNRTGLKGTVTDASTGDIVPGVRLTLVEPDRITTTNKAGNYTFKRIRPGTYTLVAELEGYVTQTLNGVIIEANALNDQDITLQRTI